MQHEVRKPSDGKKKRYDDAVLFDRLQDATRLTVVIQARNNRKDKH